MKTLGVAVKTLREIVREPLVMAVAFGFPLLLLTIYHFAFGKPQGLAGMLAVQVVNEDRAAPDPRPASELVAALRAEKFEGTPMFAVDLRDDLGAARVALAEHKAAALLIIPGGFGARVAGARGGGASEPLPEVLLQGDTTSDTFEFGRAMLDDAIRREVRRQIGRPNPMPLGLSFVKGTGTMSDFDAGVPGIIVFGILLTIVSAAMTLVREHRSGTLRRLKLTRAGAADILGGVTLAHAVEALVQAPLILGVALLFGFTMKGSFGLALAICLLLALTAIGLGLVVACFARSDGEAANLGSVALVPMAFLSGALFPMPESTLFTVAGRAVSSYELLPATHAVEALRRIMIHGEGAAGIAWQLGWLSLQAVMFFGLGVLLFRRLRMRAD